MTSRRLRPQFPLRARAHGAALLEHGLLIGLISITAIAAVARLGGEVSHVFGATSGTVETAAIDVANGGPGVSPGESVGGDGAGTGGGDLVGGGDGDVFDPTRPTVATVIASSSLDSEADLTYSTARSQAFIDPSAFGYTGSNNSVHHANSIRAETSGISWLDVSPEQVGWPGTYEVTIVAGNFNNKPFLQGVEVGLRSGGVFLTPQASSTPAPALGGTEVWTFIYDISQPQIDAGITFAMSVPTTGENRNGSFDDLEISFIP